VKEGAIVAKQYPMYRILWMLDFHLQQQNKPTSDKWRGRRLMSTAKKERTRRQRPKEF